MFLVVFFLTKKGIKIKKPLNDQQLFVVKGGAGGIRTLVQTGKPYAFYMLILAFGFRVATRPRPPIATLSSKISPVQRGIQELFPILPAPLDPQIRNNILGAVSRSATLWRNKANLLCFD